MEKVRGQEMRKDMRRQKKVLEESKVEGRKGGRNLRRTDEQRVTENEREGKECREDSD